MDKLSAQGVAVVTGAAGAIGSAICADLLADGWQLVGIDQQAPTAPERFRQFIQLDISDHAALADTLIRIAEEEDVGALINCAGITRVEPFLQQDPAVWHDLLQVNCLAPLTACQAVLPGMLRRGKGVIVQITSDSARSGAAGEAVYSASKSALVAFSKSLAQEVGRSGVRVNCVSPGAIETPMSAPNVELLAKFAKRVPLKRIGQPVDVAGAVAFLCSDKASYITGQVLSVGGGVTMVD